MSRESVDVACPGPSSQHWSCTPGARCSASALPWPAPRGTCFSHGIPEGTFKRLRETGIAQTRGKPKDNPKMDGVNAG